jgi:hypothetical protein
MGRFFKLSTFAEDDPKIVEKYFANVTSNDLPSETLSLIAKQVHPLQASLRVTLI